MIRAFTFSNLIEQLGTGAYGIVWDGHSVWISVSGNVNKLVQVDADTGVILKTISSPTVLGPSDLDWDGRHLWLSTGTGEVYVIDPVNGRADKVFDSMGSFRDSGIAVRGNEIWLGDLFSADLRVLDKSTGEVIMTLEGALREPSATLSFYRGQLVQSGRSGMTFYRVLPATRAESDR